MDEISKKKGKKALWLEVVGSEPALEDPKRLEQALQYSKRLGITDLFVQVVRSGTSWLASKYFLAEPYERCLDAHGGQDPVRAVLEWGRANTVKIHLWCNMFCLGDGTPPQWVGELGDTELFDSYGRAASRPEADPLVLDAPGYWLDPASEALFEYYQKAYDEILRCYPEADGFHLDFFRYPYYLPIKPSSAVHVGSDFGYAESSRQRFGQESGIADPFLKKDGQYLPESYDTAIMWDAWRRDQVGRYLGIFSNMLRPEQQLSVATIAWPDRAYMSSFQHWRKWLKEEMIDLAVPMMYTADHEMFSYLLQQACAFQTVKSRVLAGIGAYIFTNPKSLSKQIDIAERSDAVGYCLFSYRNLIKSGLLS